MTAAAKTSTRTGTSVNAYLVLRRDDQLLLLLRKNTHYCDGMWGFMAGHVEDGESATEGMIREAREEIGIELTPSPTQSGSYHASKNQSHECRCFFRLFIVARHHPKL